MAVLVHWDEHSHHVITIDLSDSSEHERSRWHGILSLKVRDINSLTSRHPVEYVGAGSCGEIHWPEGNDGKEYRKEIVAMLSEVRLTGRKLEPKSVDEGVWYVSRGKAFNEMRFPTPYPRREHAS